MKSFYTETNINMFSHVFHCLESTYASKDSYELNIVKYIFEYTLYDEQEHTMSFACQTGNLEVVKYLVQTGASDFEKHIALFQAAENGHLEVVQYFVSEGVSLCYGALFGASRGGHLEILQYLISVGGASNNDDSLFEELFGASQGGHLEVIQYLVSIGTPVHPTEDRHERWFPVREAAENGHLEVVQYLVSLGAGHESEALKEASLRGHFEVVRYLVSVGANVRVFNDAAIRGAAYRGHWKIFHYLVSHIQERNCFLLGLYYLGATVTEHTLRSCSKFLPPTSFIRERIEEMYEPDWE